MGTASQMPSPVCPCRGQAPDAKLAFISLGSSGAQGDVFTPQALATG